MLAAVQCGRRQTVVTYYNEAISKVPKIVLICPQLKQERSMYVHCFLLPHDMMVAQGSEA